MASNITESNGKSKHEMKPTDIKILVVGEAKVGKRRFIETITARHGDVSAQIEETEFAKVYPCTYIVKSEQRNIKIFKIFSGSDGVQDYIKIYHLNTNAFVFIYAVDDPSSFHYLHEKWIQKLGNDGSWLGQPAILVGNKKDLREDEQVIQRLAQLNQTPVTQEQGVNLGKEYEMEFFDCSSIDEDDANIFDAFDYIVEEAVLDWNKHNM